MRTGFDNDKYIALQAEHIRSRIDQFGGKLLGLAGCSTTTMRRACCPA
ncbi:MAG: DUF1846 domain-containing protein [Eggerthellaceae bacterium]